MTESDLNNVRAILDAYGQSTIAAMREKLITPKQRRNGLGQFISTVSNAVATGNLVSSISYDVNFDGISSTIEFSMADYGIYVDGGRRPGKMPPLSRIQEWTRIKGIPEKYAFPIAKNIGRYGISARPFFGSTIEEKMAQLVEDLEVAYAADLNVYLQNKAKLL